MNHRVAVTGLGVICSIGRNAAGFRESLERGRAGIGPIELVDRSLLRFENAAEVHGYNPLDHFTAKQLSLLDRFAQFALVAAREAIGDAGIEWTGELRLRAAIVTGSSAGGHITEDLGYIDLYRENRNRVNPFTIPLTMSNAAASHISMEFGIRGPAFTLSTACSSSNHAIGQAFRMVRNGEAPMAIAGGSDTPFAMGFLKAWEAMRVVAPDTCRPFSKDRRGLILGEGAGMLVLEPLESAAARGAKVYGEIVGFGMSADAHHVTQPSAEGPALAMRLALEDAGIEPERIGYINAHGTGTPANDPAEVAAIRNIFGAYADRLAVSSTKSMHGHVLGGAGAVEAVATLLALQYGFLPPTANFTAPDPDCAIDVVPNSSRRAGVEYALSNSFAFGGLNAVLAFRRAG